MGLSMRVGATALTSLVALNSVANAQGFFYQDLRLQCDTKFNYQYLGCAATNSRPFAFSPSNWDPATTADNSKSYINFDTGDFVNQTVTPYFCSETCRAHGFKYAALWDKSCNCASSLDYKQVDGTAVTLSTAIDPASDDKCTKGQDGNTYPNCGGDLRENCGSNQGARIFVDPSFPDERTLTDPATIAADYAVLGCFKNAKFPSSVDAVTTVEAADAATCLSYCADLGMPYAYMIGETPLKCHCGSEFNKNAANVDADANPTCFNKCSAPTEGGCTGQDCCGSSNGPYPVYANPKLMGCFIPVIPGITNPDSDTPAFDGYNCFATPASIAARAASPVVAYAAKTMSASASFLATASPVAGNAFVNYGCYQDTVVANLFDTVIDSGLTATDISVDTCVKFCDGASHKFAAVYGKQPNNKCACGDAIKGGVTPNGAMESCNQPCAGSALQNCGGDNGPLVYAKSDVMPNQWAETWSSSWSKTLTYSCTSTGKYYISIP
ncbi:hypothetical protein HD806DRAFT_379420 [Xylariaceae sp. AK1471]|nr:hypothetical protein HD806DRAFT_379420 [Xylariaceae sp. AK1471]